MSLRTTAFGRITLRLLHRVARTPAFATWLWLRHAAHARRLGLDRLYCVLSFDCDIPEDAGIVPDLDLWLSGMGLSPSYAVPAEHLRAAPGPYRELHRRGREFLAHGGRSHSERVGGTYASTFFYDRGRPAELFEDVKTGRAAFLEILGIAPTGFRAPHFGAFQSAQDLALLHRTLADDGYTFSTSTVPWYGLRHAPAYRTTSGIVEMALSGCRDAPLQVLDSNGFVARPRPGRMGSYARQFAGLVDLFLDRGLPGLINTYADPSQVVDWPEFRSVVQHLADRRVPCVSYAELLSRISLPDAPRAPS